MALIWVDIKLEDEMLSLISSNEPETCGGQTGCRGCTGGPESSVSMS